MASFAQVLALNALIALNALNALNALKALNILNAFINLCFAGSLLHKTVLIGHAKHPGVQKIYCNQFSKHPYYGARRQDLVFFPQPGVEINAVALSPDTVWYARVLLLFSMKW